MFSRHIAEFLSYRVSIVSAALWPIPLLALNLYQYLGIAPSSSIDQILASRYGITSLSGMIIIGTVVYLLYSRMLLGTGAAIQEERVRGTLEPLLLTPARRMTVLLGFGVGSLVEGSWWISAVFILSWIIFGIQVSVSDWAALIIALVSTMLALVAVGIFFAGFLVLTRAADQLATSLMGPIRYVSGVAFPIAALPALLQSIAYILPVAYGIEALRRTILQHATLSDLTLILLPLYSLTVLLVVSGNVLLAKVEARVKRTGDLYSV